MRGYKTAGKSAQKNFSTKRLFRQSPNKSLPKTTYRVIRSGRLKNPAITNTILKRVRFRGYARIVQSNQSAGPGINAALGDEIQSLLLLWVSCHFRKAGSSVSMLWLISFLIGNTFPILQFQASGQWQPMFFRTSEFYQCDYLIVDQVAALLFLWWRYVKKPVWQDVPGIHPML